MIQLDVLEIYLSILNIEFTRLDGQTNVLDRQDLIDEFNNGTIPVFLLSTKAGGVGLNLASASVVVLFDLDFNPHNDLQAENRAHRVGQLKEVMVYRLVCRGTIEERILELGQIKIALDAKVSNKRESKIVDRELLKFIKKKV